MSLTVKQKSFVDHYIVTGNASEAARLAGYSKKTADQMGCENLKKPNVRKAIDDRLAELESERIADATEVLTYLTSVMRGQIDEDVVVVESIGEGMGSRACIIRKQVGAKDRNKAAELLGKRYRLYVDKVEASVDAEIKVVLDGDAKDWAQ